MRVRSFILKAAGTAVVSAAFIYLGLAGLTGHSGMAKLDDDQVGLITDPIGASTHAVQSLGYRFAWPLLQELHVWQKSPQEYRMQGNRYEHAGHVPRLIARGPDGSSFWFERVLVHYAVDEARLERLLQNVGTDPQRLARVVNTFARPVLRNSFGTFTGEEIASVENWRSATEEAVAVLRRLLVDYGIHVLQIGTTKPRFPAEYEKTIERRKVADQETDSLAQEAARLSAGQDERLEQLGRKKELEKQQVVSGLQGKLEDVRRANRRAEHDSMVAHADRIRAGARARDESMAKAAWQLERWGHDATGLTEKVRSLGRAGRPLVRRAIARMLSRAGVSALSIDRSSNEKASQ